MGEIFFHIPLEPIPKGRPRFSRQGHSYTPSKTRRYESEARKILRQLYRKEPTKNPITFEIIFSLEKPKSVKRKLCSVKPDLDNLVKSFLDASEGILFKGDSQIIEIMCSKRYSCDKFQVGTHATMTVIG